MMHAEMLISQDDHAGLGAVGFSRKVGRPPCFLPTAPTSQFQDDLVVMGELRPCSMVTPPCFYWPLSPASRSFFNLKSAYSMAWDLLANMRFSICSSTHSKISGDKATLILIFCLTMYHPCPPKVFNICITISYLLLPYGNRWGDHERGAYKLAGSVLGGGTGCPAVPPGGAGHRRPGRSGGYGRTGAGNVAAGECGAGKAKMYVGWWQVRKMSQVVQVVQVVQVTFNFYRITPQILSKTRVTRTTRTTCTHHKRLFWVIV